MIPVTIIDEEEREESITNERDPHCRDLMQLCFTFILRETLSLSLSLLTGDEQELLGKTDVDAKQERDAKTYTRIHRESRDTSLHPPPPPHSAASGTWVLWLSG